MGTTLLERTAHRGAEAVPIYALMCAYVLSSRSSCEIGVGHAVQYSEP